MTSRMEELIDNHGVAISRIKDCEDDMQVCKGDIDNSKILLVRNDCPVYAFFFVFPFISLFNPHSFIMTSYVLIYSYFSSLTACLYVRYSAR